MAGGAAGTGGVVSLMTDQKSLAGCDAIVSEVHRNQCAGASKIEVVNMVWCCGHENGGCESSGGLTVSRLEMTAAGGKYVGEGATQRLR